MRLKLTDLAIRKLTPTDKQITYWDTAFPGFGVRVSRTKNFVVKHEGKLKTIGRL